MQSFYKPEDKDYVLSVIRASNVIYASMEIALHPEVHTYSGGLGVLAGDTLRSCADLQLNVAGLTLLYRNGYFVQVLEHGYQREADEPWDVERFTIPIPEARVQLMLEGRDVIVEPRVGIIVGHDQRHLVPIIFLDTGIDANSSEDQGITAYLYGGDHRLRLKQEAILGIAGKRVLRSLGCRSIETFHMNEGHAAFAPMEDVRYLSRYYAFNQEAVKRLVKSAHVFTTHTPVPAGHDRFSYDLMRSVIGPDDFAWDTLPLTEHNSCNMTRIALDLSRFSNGVTRKHGDISRRMFPGYKIHSITNAVHLPTWISPHIKEILDRKMPSWREEPGILEHCYQVITHEELWTAHRAAKRELLALVRERTGRELSEDLLTIGFARRFAAYKRADLMFADLERFRNIAKGKLQVIFAGEAHPKDEQGKAIIRHVIEVAQKLRGEIDIVFLEDYDMEVARHLVAGCDLWQNNPVPPQEASGTSGMKAAANGIPNLSTLDGWWIEGITRSPQAGWIIHHRMDGEDHLSLYENYEHIIRIFYNNPERWREHMVHALSLASHFNTHRMVNEYLDRAWSLDLY